MVTGRTKAMLTTAGHALQRQSHQIQFNLTVLNTGWMETKERVSPQSRCTSAAACGTMPPRPSQAPCIQTTVSCPSQGTASVARPHAEHTPPVGAGEASPTHRLAFAIMTFCILSRGAFTRMDNVHRGGQRPACEVLTAKLNLVPVCPR